MEVNRMKLLSVVLVILLMIAAVFAGCSQNNQSPSPTASTVPYPDTEDNIDNYNNGLAMGSKRSSMVFEIA
jgi:ABC-type oligopeptide transport system substrate-binding subunit